MPNGGRERDWGRKLGWNWLGRDQEGGEVRRGQSQSSPPGGRCPPGIGTTEGWEGKKGGRGLMSGRG
eukprot:218942-Rhodomonas_salina.1